MKSVYTIGHSNHTLEHFVTLVKAHEINLIADVRSVPFSRFAPQFNQKAIKASLGLYDIVYEYMGDSLGGKFIDPALLTDDGLPDFEKLIKNNSFCKGLNDIITKIENGSKLALMYAEKEPQNCHRFMLISRALSKRGVQAVHILADGSVVDNDELLVSLASGTKKNNEMQLDLFGIETFDADEVYESLMNKSMKKR